MERLRQVEHRAASLKELQAVISAMRSLAAARVQDARAALDGVRMYAEVVDDALAAALPLIAPAPPGGGPGPRPGLVVAFCAEHGFVGGFNDRLLAAAVAAANAQDGLMVVGSRGAALADAQPRPLLWSRPQATRAAGLTEVSRSTATMLAQLIAQGNDGAVTLVYARAEGGGWSVAQRSLLPFDPTPIRRRDDGALAPLHNLADAELVARLIDEFAFGEIMRAAAESFAAEHTARLTATDSAHRNIGHKLEELAAIARQRRQEEITEELLDVLTGANALFAP